MHEADGLIFLQLWHVGRISHPALQPDGMLPVAPSAIKPAGQAFIENAKGGSVLDVDMKINKLLIIKLFMKSISTSEALPGTGAGGGTLAYRLAPSGKSILLLERGDYLPREKANWDPEAVFVDNRYLSKEIWYDHEGLAFQPGVHYFVGGASKMYGAALFRLRQEDFGELRHRDGISPAWPLRYQDLEPYYTQAEQLYCVHGAHGEDPTEPPASGPYPYPPVSHEPRIQQMHDNLVKAGYHPFHAPAAIMLEENYRAHSKCIRCDTCDGYPCLAHAKADAEVVAVRPALKHPNVTLVTQAEAVKLTTSPSGREVTEVVVKRNDGMETYKGSIVVVSAGTANAARLLLLSANDRHPNGLANGSDQVGRNYMFHNSQSVVALSIHDNDTVFQKTLALNDFYFGADVPSQQARKSVIKLLILSGFSS